MIAGSLTQSPQSPEAMRDLYCKFQILKETCSWWDFNCKNMYQKEIDWVYPRMKNELKIDNKI